MSRRVLLDVDVYRAALDRIRRHYRDGDRVVVAFSAGKDSGVCLELAIIAARLEGCLPVEVFMVDDEAMFPGTFEYAERVAARKEVKFDWLVCREPIINIFNRECPYWWAFDPQVPEDLWVRKPPSFAQECSIKNLYAVISIKNYPPPPGKKLIVIIGLRVQESMRRRMAIYGTGGSLTLTPSEGGHYVLRPIYDWTDRDVWKAIADNKWDYNHAYDVLYRHGCSRVSLRIAPPTQSLAGVEHLKIAAQAWPKWFDRLARRCPGVRTVAMFGRRAVTPFRYAGETWEDCYKRECIEQAPEWIRKRSITVMERVLSVHARHAITPLPQTARSGCENCQRFMNSWEAMANSMYLGDPFGQYQNYVKWVEPEEFRPGAGKWEGKPSLK